MVFSKGCVLFLTLLSFLCVVQGKVGPAPCHRNKVAQGKGVKCEGVHLPPNLCQSCALKPVKPNGLFPNCQSIYRTTSPPCKAALRKYADQNPCDWKRKEQLHRFNRLDQEALDFFIYSLCEECCDCIKKGTKPFMFNVLAKKHSAAKPTLYSPTRGNCPAHAYFDVSLSFSD